MVVLNMKDHLTDGVPQHYGSCNWLFRIYTVKKIGAVPNPQKRFGRFENDYKYVESSKKRIKKSTKPLKDLPVYRGEDPFFLETFLSSVEQKKGFVGKFETWKVPY